MKIKKIIGSDTEKKKNKYNDPSDLLRENRAFKKGNARDRWKEIKLVYVFKKKSTYLLENLIEYLFFDKFDFSTCT